MMNLIEMSIIAGVLIIAIIIIRSLFLNHLPKITFPILWGVVLMRLLIPFSFDTGLSLNMSSLPLFTNDVSTVEPMPIYIDDGIVIGNQSVNNQIEIPTIANTGNLQNNGATNVVISDSNEINWLIVVWIAGTALSATFFTFGHWKACQKLSTAVMLETEFLNNWKTEQKLKRSLLILTSDQVTTPLTLGILKPKIIIPAAMDIQNSTNFHYMLAHEFYHIKRVDALWKLLAVIVVCIHWFNPIVWIAFVLANRDLEISCDAWVMKKFKENTKKAYAYALISMAEYQSKVTPLYNHFARQAIKERIETNMKTKKKTTMLGIIAAFTSVSLLAFTAFASSADEPYDSLQEEASELLQDSPQDDDGLTYESDDYVQGSDDLAYESNDYVQDSVGFTVIEIVFDEYTGGSTFVDDGSSAASDDELDIYEIAQIASNYIWNMFNESIDGMYMVLEYGCCYVDEGGGDFPDWEDLEDAFWLGLVYATNPEVDAYIPSLFTFLQDSKTGEILSLSDGSAMSLIWEIYDQGPISECFDMVSDEDRTWSDQDVETCLAEQHSPQSDFVLETFSALSQAEIEEAMEVAEGYAQRHFNSSNIVRIEAAAPYMDGEPSTNFEGDFTIGFEIEDETGHVIVVGLQRETNRLVGIGRIIALWSY